MLVYYYQAQINDRDPEFLNPDRYVTPQPRECHNDWLEDIVELGLVGVLIRWSLIGLVIYYGIMAIPGNLLVLFLLTALAASSIYAFFFFGLRLPSTGMVFWLLLGLTALASVPSVPMWGFKIEFSPWLTILLLLGLAVLIWETNLKALLASYYFMKFQKATSNHEKEYYCHKTLEYASSETIYNTHALIGYLHVNSLVAFEYAEQMWSKYDGMTPGWVMHYNKGSAAAKCGHWELAHKHYMVSHRLLPSFEPTVAALREIIPKVPFPKKGEIVKQAREELKERVLRIMQEINNTELQKQNLHLQLQNVVIQEAARMNIPEGWQYVPELGQFLSPDEFKEFQENKMRQMQVAADQPTG